MGSDRTLYLWYRTLRTSSILTLDFYLLTAYMYVCMLHHIHRHNSFARLEKVDTWEACCNHHLNIILIAINIINNIINHYIVLSSSR